MYFYTDPAVFQLPRSEWGDKKGHQVFILETSSVSGLGIFTHNETKSFEAKPRIWKYLTYFDGTVVIRIINVDPNKISLDPELWVRPMLSLRIIYPNGTVSEIDKYLEIPEFNWHITMSFDGYRLDPINIFVLQKGFLLVRYFNAPNSDDITTYEEWGRVIDFNGNLYSRFWGAYIENGTWYPSAATIVTNVDPEKGFIRIVGRNVTYIEWQQYTTDDEFNFIKLYEGNITLPQNGSSIFNVVGTVDDGYSIIMGNSTDSINSDNLLEISATVYALTKGYHDKQFGAPKLLYQTNLPNVTISRIFYGISSTGIGQVCTLTVTQNNVDYYVKLNFLSSGSITEIIPLSNLPELPSNSTTGWLVDSIPYGGYVFYCYFLNANNQTNAYVYYFNEYAKKFIEWDGPEPSVLNVKGILIILPNNTMLISQIEDYNAWSFLTTDIPIFAENSKNDYLNFQVKSTSPSINENISTSANNIKITYNDPVELNDGNISIYQIDNSGNYIIRQFVNGIKSSDFCSISDNGLTVTVNVIKSTFNIPSSKFFVKVDSNFVRNQAYKESLMGIYNVWKFNTNSSEETFADTISGVLRLTTEGTEYYENLNSTEKSNFFFYLQIELSKIIPVDIKRLSSNEKTQIDTTVSSSRQILVSLNIHIESSKEEKSVASIVDDLNEMIKYKSMTSISLNPTTKYLDEAFGFEPKQNLWDEYKWKFLGVMSVLAILVVFFLIAKKMNRSNVAVLQLGLIIFDFVMDILFVSNNGKVIEALYIPSVIFLTVPIIINTIGAFYIINNENNSKPFLDWFTQHEKVASVFTILSSADIETLSILHSNLAGFKFFQAPISTKGKNRIFWASCLTIFVEDVPQLIIQLIYHNSVVTYDIIPLLALISSCLSLLINIIGRLFQAINSCRHGTLEFDSTQNKDDFESLQQLQIPTTERNSNSDESTSHSIDLKEEINSEKNNLTKEIQKVAFKK
ncbi:hypothetical protein Glove_109g37 [Diversispora epigaea]|uniref:Uncharacterized protein n=1 Tax=Diversispora epigaea TaxID=1348612 RepID=A0A397JD29_9GLOM|nr:hypothetical protein Glove_109g37 [Diversispora epigaea]